LPKPQTTNVKKAEGADGSTKDTKNPIKLLKAKIHEKKDHEHEDNKHTGSGPHDVKDTTNQTSNPDNPNDPNEIAHKQGHLYDPSMPVEEIKRKLDLIKGHLVWMPLTFLEDANMAETGLQVNQFTESIYT